MNTEFLEQFFLYGTILNYGLILLTFFLYLVMKDFVYNLHGKMFGISKEFMQQTWYIYLAIHKLLTFVFWLIPYIVIRLFL